MIILKLSLGFVGVLLVMPWVLKSVEIMSGTVEIIQTLPIN